MEQREGEKDTLATSLQDRLTKFASSETAEREQALPELVAFIKLNANKEIIDQLADKEFQPRLEDAVNRTLDIEFDTEGLSQTPIFHPWKGEYTVVALSDDGKVMGATSVEGEVWKAYGDLNQYALVKALCELHLVKAGRAGGLSNVDNFKYLVGLGIKPFDELFTGSAPSTVVDGKKIFVAGSGCAPKREYLKDLLSEAEPEIDTQAGLFEKVFSEYTAMFLVHSGTKLRTFPEPKEIRQLRINN